MRLIVTRPAAQAQAWLQDLQAAGHDALSLPLIDIHPVADPAPLQAAWQRWDSWQAVMFVSAQAVQMFFAQRPATTLASNATVCWATGPGTRQALLRAGVPQTCVISPPEDAAQFDSEALWQVVKNSVQGHAPVLIVRGGDALDGAAQGAGRDWLAQQLQDQGVPVAWLVAYQRAVPNWTLAQQQLARTAAHDGSLWLLTSSQAVKHLSVLMPQQDWSQALALATHERVAFVAHQLGFGQCEVIRPSLSDLLAHLA